MRRVLALLFASTAVAFSGLGSCSSDSGSGGAAGSSGSSGGSCSHKIVRACSSAQGPINVSLCELPKTDAFLCEPDEGCVLVAGHIGEGQWDCYPGANCHFLCPHGYDCGCPPAPDGGAAGGGGASTGGGGASNVGGAGGATTSAGGGGAGGVGIGGTPAAASTGP
jgi:hypothetical protein